ncbi:MAG TPA: indole-3-glycerol phosphate synthase [Actinomycetes bacterium]|nr:indole-3-glycerol phosphate synthase [Actinomycetes bacterium]
MITMLVLTEQTLTPHDVSRIAELHAPDPVTAHVIVPTGTDQSTLDQVVDDLTRVDLDELSEDLDPQHMSDADKVRYAQQLVDQSVALLNAAGLTATGSLVPQHPVDATAALANEKDVDEIIVVTEPHLVTDVLRRDWATRLRHSVKRPVLHFIAGTDQIVS